MMRMIRRMTAVVMGALMILSALPARAFTLPEALRVIEAEAFRGDGGLTEVTLPDGAEAIGDYAFADCENLNQVTIPGSVEVIGAGAFQNCGPALLIRTEAGSAAAAYARSHLTDYQADTHYRALIFGQTYSGTELALTGPANDMNAVRACLGEFGTTSWTVTARSNLTAEGMKDAIASVFGGATTDDVSLLYYSGHGNEDGSLVGVDGFEDLLPPAELKGALDQIPGRKIVIVDACFSGQLIAEDAEDEEGSDDAVQAEAAYAAADPAAQFIAAFQSAFASRLLRGALNTSGYYVITAAREDQESEEGQITTGGSTRQLGFFTYGFCLGLGYNGVTFRAGTLYADANGDQAVSLSEAATYAARIARSMNPKQQAVIWPSDCSWFAPFRP